MSIRQKFEEWAGDQGFCLTRTFDDDGYQELRTQGPWDAWQAAITSPDGYILVPVKITKEIEDVLHKSFEYGYSAESTWDLAIHASRPEAK